MNIQAVQTRSDLKKFIHFPYEWHRHTPHWIPPLRLDQKQTFNPKKNSALGHCDYQFFLLFDKNRVIGRIIAYVNPIANAHWHDRIGFFGHYECIDNPNAAHALLKAATDWLQERGMRLVRGPWNFVTQDLGFVSSGFDLAPVVMSSYNPPYYNDQMTACGLKKAKDLLVYNCDLASDYRIPGRFLAFTDRIAARYRVTVRPLNMKNLLADTRIIVRLTNTSLADNWGYYPVDEAEAEQMAADLKLIVDPKVILIAEVDGAPIGFILTLPDVNTILTDLNGRLLPFGIFKLLRGIKKINRYRIWGMGMIPQYQKKGISVLLFRKLNDILAPKHAYIEANWVLEDNALMNNALRQLKFALVKTYRIYEKTIGD